MMKFYDSDLASDNPANFHSDHEPPKDKIKDKKLLKKDALKRAYKIIVRTGAGLPKPAKYDEIQYRIMEIQDENDEENNLKRLAEAEIMKTNMGLNDREEWFDYGVEGMKKGEIALIMIEHLKKDENDMKVLGNKLYYYIELIDWITIIDLDSNFEYMKTVVLKGKGIDRCELSDEISFNYQIYCQNLIIKEEKFESEVQIDYLFNSSKNENARDPNVLKIIRTMKLKEKTLTSIKLEAFERISNIRNLDELFKDFENKENLKINIEIEINHIVKIDDIFHDQSTLKRQIIKGRSTCKPESNSLMFFDLQIKSFETNEIYHNSLDLKSEPYKSEAFPLEISDENQENTEFLTNTLNCLRFYVDEFKFSKVLKNALKRMKKGEYAEIICHDLNLVNKGFDYEIFQQIKNKAELKSIRYLITLYNFTEGKNTFTMTLDEKIENAKRKKEIGVQLIKNGFFKRGLKCFGNINTYFDLGQFSEEEKEVIKDYKLSSLLNTTLCLLKLNKWKELILVSDKILSIDSKNMKAIYRKVFAYKEIQNYEGGLKIINQYFNENKKEPNNSDLINELEFLKSSMETLNVKYKNKEKKMYSIMYSNMFEER